MDLGKIHRLAPKSTLVLGKSMRQISTPALRPTDASIGHPCTDLAFRQLAIHGGDRPARQVRGALGLFLGLFAALPRQQVDSEGPGPLI